jgi:hypothetical protein
MDASAPEAHSQNQSIVSSGSSNMPSRFVSAALLTCMVGFAGYVLAQASEPPAFAAEMKAVSAEDFKKLVEGNTFEGKLPNGTTIRLKFDAKGYLYVNAGSFNESSKWDSEFKDGKADFCSNFMRQGRNCSEAKVLGTDWAYRRTSDGQLVLLKKV